MLTMGEPIPIKSAWQVGTPGKLFGEKIRANYEQMQGRIDPADILHFLSAPPEFYIADTGMTTLVNQQNRTENRDLALSLVNNVLNRILVSEQLTFTYQDRVFVENILKKLGVTDVRAFIRQVQMIKEEAGNVRELLSLYESGKDTIRLIRESYNSRSEAREIQEKEGKKRNPEAVDRLAAALLNRLQTGEIYREISRFATFCLDNRALIDRRELSFSEQRIAASYLALHHYRNSIYAQDQNMVCDWPDRYETWYVSHTDEDYRQTVNAFLQAALLQAIDQLFHLRYTEFTKNTGLWHEFIDALHVSVRNTLQRFENFTKTGFFNIQDQEAYHRTVRQFEKLEINALRNLFAASAQMTVKAQSDRETAQMAPMHQTAFMETANQEWNIDMRRQEHARLWEHPPQGAKIRRVEWEEEIRRQLETINRQNIERMKRLSEYTSRVRESENLRIDRKTVEADAIRALTGQAQGIPAYFEQETLHTAKTEGETEKLREILGDETMRMFETIRGFRENPRQYPNVTASGEQTMNLFLQDIAAAGEAKTVVSDKEPWTIAYHAVQQTAAKEAERAHLGNVRDERPAIRRPERTNGQTEKGMELFHRQSGQTVSEEKLQELLQTWGKSERIHSSKVRDTFHEEEQVTEIVRSKVNEMKGKQDEEIARMISQTVKRQLDTLSEKVYGKLERRMDSERRRRGL